MSWNDERIALLKELWAEGLTCTRIAARLGGVTRNSVIGKVRRLGLPFREPGCAGPRELRSALPRRKRSPAEPRTRRKAKQRSAFMFGLFGSPTALAAEPLPPRHETDVARVSSLGLEPKHCRFIPGDPAGVSVSDPLFCGLDVIPTLSYCRAHAARCFNTPETRQAVAAQVAAEALALAEVA